MVGGSLIGAPLFGLLLLRGVGGMAQPLNCKIRKQVERLKLTEDTSVQQSLEALDRSTRSFIPLLKVG